MLYQIGMLCKHFKGKTLEEKNIYRVIKLGVSGKDIDTNEITYTGEGMLDAAENLVVGDIIKTLFGEMFDLFMLTYFKTTNYLLENMKIFQVNYHKKNNNFSFKK